MLIEGLLIKCNRTQKEFKGKQQDEKLYITLAEAKISDENMEKIQEAFADSGKTFTPDWVKHFDGFANFATKFELPCILVNGAKRDSIEEEIEGGLKWFKAPVKISVIVKKGALYPASIKLLDEGEEINPFAEFDEEE